MARVLEITLPSDRTQNIVQLLKQTPGVIGLRVQPGISLQPHGDLITAQTTSRALPEVARALQREGIGMAASSFTTSEPQSFVSCTHAETITGDASEATWEEMEYNINKQSHMTVNGMLVMAFAGMVATIGLASGALHIITGAKLIAPGFEILAQISLGIVGQSRSWRRGIGDTIRGYLALIAGAMLMAGILEAVGKNPAGGSSTYLSGANLLSYWTTIHVTAILSSSVGALAGAVLISANRSLLTAGVMVIMSLVPSAAAIGIGLANGRFDIALGGFFVWGINVGLTIVASLLVFSWKRFSVHRRRTIS